jgi:Predicted pyridoxal phosphate-dependent enzyme apparently involved in regulation of cell wall biogenesis
MNNRIYLSLAHMSGREQNFIQEAFDTNWVVPLGPNVDAFEKSLSEYIHSNEVVALSSGTAAIHLGLILLGVQPGDEVICQSFTFAATANPITYIEAKPVFVDSEPDTWNIDPILLEEAIKDRFRKTGKLPKAIIPVHLYGMPAKMDEINKIAKRYGIPVLEDAAEALGSELNNQKCGSFGELGILSFNGNKMITTSGGGALICRTKEEAVQAKFYATQARDNAPHYQHSKIGYNYRMSNICAGIGRGQMFVLDEHISRRREIHALYTELLKDVSGITVMQNPAKNYHSNFWLTCILVDPPIAGKTREDIRLAMDAANIETRPLWKPMHLQPVFAEAPFYGNGTSEHLFDIGLCLPSGPTLTDDDIKKVVEVIMK